MPTLIDLSHVISGAMPVYPGDQQTTLVQTKHFHTDQYNNHRLEISMHAGTHIDSPMHMTDSRVYISELSLDSFIGRGALIDVRNQTVIHMKPEYEVLVPEESILLLHTGYDKLYGTMAYYDHPVLDNDFGAFLLRKKIKVLGMDMPSPDKYPFSIHKVCFENRICIMENLTNLDQLLGVENFEVIALPLHIQADSSMVRAVARIL